MAILEKFLEKKIVLGGGSIKRLGKESFECVSVVILYINVCMI